MRLEIKLERAIAAESIPLLRSHLAHCDPGILSFDVSGAASGQVTVDLEAGASAEQATRRVQKVAARVVATGLVPPTKILERVSFEGITYQDDITRRLEEAGWLLALGRGAWGTAGALAALIRAFDDDFRKCALELGASDARFPSLLRTSFLNRIRYFDSFAHHTTFAIHLRPDVDALDAFSERMRRLPNGIDVVSEAAPSTMILSPTVCYHLYDALCDRSVPERGLSVTALGSCYRWEGSNIEDLRRLWEFSMRELIVVGTKDLVLDVRQRAMELTLDYCRRLGLEAWLENANDPFFSADASTKSAYQRGFGMKWELRLPYTASGESLAAASFNNMQRTFAEPCAIRLSNGETAFSGCIGWGLERWAYAFIARHGMSVQDWPDEIRARCSGES